MNVDFFPTNNVRQLYMAPFAEYFILNIRLLSGGFLLINFVQFFALINCLILASLIAKSFLLSRKWQLSSFVLAITIPMGLLQATTTQTDLVVSFFLLSFVYFGISLTREKSLQNTNLLFLGLSLSLGILTKSTFYIFAFPFCLVFGVYYLNLYKIRAFHILFFLILAIILLNGPFLHRNYHQFGSVLGPQKTSPLYLPNLNDKFGFKETLSNGMKNIGLHLALPSNSWNEGIDKIIVVFHEWISFPLSSATTNFLGTTYKTVFSFNHDTVGNFFHILMFVVLSVVIFSGFRTTPRRIKIYLLLLMSGFVLFAFFLKWQPWQTRLDLPIFFLMAPLLAYGLSVIKWKSANNFVCLTLLCASVGILFVFEPTKPILGSNSVFFKNNNSYIFDYSAAAKIESELTKNDISNIGLILGGDSWEWQYWLLSKNRKYQHVYFSRELIGTPNFNKYFCYRALIIDNPYLVTPGVKNLLRDRSVMLEMPIASDKETLVIFKKEQGTLIMY